MSVTKPPLPTNFSLPEKIRVYKRQDKQTYALDYIGGRWYYDRKTQTSRALPSAEQARLSMLAESYEQQIAQLRIQLMDCADELAKSFRK